MTGLRERKRRRTVAAIHDAGMRLFAERGYAAVTVADIADAAEVSRATVFAYYRAKEDIVLGDAPSAIEALRVALVDAADAPGIVQVVREWLRTLAGWVEPELLLQRRLAEEVAAVGAARSRVERAIEDEIADALARVMDPARPLPPRLVAGALASALAAVESEAAQRMERGAAPLAPEEIDALLDAAVAFVDGGLERLRAQAATI